MKRNEESAPTEDNICFLAFLAIASASKLLFKLRPSLKMDSSTMASALSDEAYFQRARRDERLKEKFKRQCAVAEKEKQDRS